MNEYRMVCDYPNCHRIIRMSDDKKVACSACGHGHLVLSRPRNICYHCGEPIYCNVQPPPTEVMCGACTSRSATYYTNREQELKTTFHNHDDFLQKMAAKDNISDGDKLRAAREQKGWTQATMAFHLGCSAAFVSLMERNCKPLISSALDMVRLQRISPYGEPEIVKS